MSDLIIPERGAPITADDLVRVERQVAGQIGSVGDLSTLQEWRARARALENYIADREMQGPMRGVQRRAEARIGELLGEAKRGSNQHSVTAESSAIHKDDRADFRILARAGELDLDEGEWRRSRKALVSLVRNRLGLIPKTPPLPNGVYRVIVADPPWQLDTGPDSFGTSKQKGHDSLAYEQMSVARIGELPVEECAADDAHLYLWTTNRYVEAAYGVARAWGFKPSVLLVWAKTPRGVGLGDAYKLTTEFILYARRGNWEESEISIYRLQSLVRFARETNQDVLYTIHDWSISGDRSDTINLIEHWRTANICDLAGNIDRQLPGSSYRGGRRVDGIPICYWRKDRWLPLAQYWNVAARVAA